MLSQKQQRALEALLQNPTKKSAAIAAGISDRTLRRYFDFPEFVEAYNAAIKKRVEEATQTIQLSMTPAILTLRAIATDKNESSQTRVTAARSLLEYGLRMTELKDVLDVLDGLE